MLTKFYSKKYNKHFSVQFIIRVYQLYVEKYTEDKMNLEYTPPEFNNLLEKGIPEEFLNQLLHNAELEGINIEDNFM